jgi:hypothetical protein
LLLSSTIGFLRVKRWESSIRAATAAPQSFTREDMERDLAIRRNLENVFGIPMDEEEHQYRHDEHGNVVVLPAQEIIEEARLARDLRAAGLL